MSEWWLICIYCIISISDRGHFLWLQLVPFVFYSAYCGGLWLASLCVMCKMARLVDSEGTYQRYRNILDRGSAAFDKLLWNGWVQTSICCLQGALLHPVTLHLLKFSFKIRQAMFRFWPVLIRLKILNHPVRVVWIASSEGSWLDVDKWPELAQGGQ